MLSGRVNPPKITLKLPAEEDEKPNLDPLGSSAGPSRKKPRYDTSGVPDEYSVHIPADRSKNTFVFTERPRIYGPGTPNPGVDQFGRKKREKGKCRLCDSHFYPFVFGLRRAVDAET